MRSSFSVSASVAGIGLEGEGVAPAVPEVAAADVQDDAVEPAPEPFRLPQVGEREVGLEHRLLHHVPRDFLVRHHAERHARRHRLVAGHEAIERLSIPGARPRHQLTVRSLLHSHALPFPV
jgi:hypothetical protein